MTGNKEILITHISSIDFKNASVFFRGYIRFAFLGGQESKGGLSRGAHDENTVIFDNGRQTEFESFRDELQKRINNPKPNLIQPVASGLGDLEKLAELRDKGILTQEEFQKKKSQILGL